MNNKTLQEMVEDFVDEYESHGLPDHKAKEKLKYYFQQSLQKAYKTGQRDTAERYKGYVEWSKEWIEQSLDYVVPYCDKCGHEAEWDGDGDPEVAVRDWLQCTNEKCDNPVSLDGGEYTDLKGEGNGILMEADILLTTKDTKDV